MSKLGTSNIFQQEGNSERICWIFLKQKIEPVAVKFNHSGYTFGKIHNVDSKVSGVLLKQISARKRAKLLFQSATKVRDRKLWACEGDRHWLGNPSTHFPFPGVHSGVCGPAIDANGIFRIYFREDTRNTLTAQHRRPACPPSAVSNVALNKLLPCGCTFICSPMYWVLGFSKLFLLITAQPARLR